MGYFQLAADNERKRLADPSVAYIESLKRAQAQNPNTQELYVQPEKKKDESEVPLNTATQKPVTVSGLASNIKSGTSDTSAEASDTSYTGPSYANYFKKYQDDPAVAGGTGSDSNVSGILGNAAVAGYGTYDALANATEDAAFDALQEGLAANTGTGGGISSIGMGSNPLGVITGGIGMYNMLTGESRENQGGYASNIGSGAASGAAIGSSFGPWGTAIGAGVGAIAGALKTVFGSESATEVEDKRWANLIKQGINPFGYDEKPDFGNESYSDQYKKYIEQGVDPNFVGKLADGTQVNMKFLQSQNEADLTGADIEKNAMWFEAFGADWWNKLTESDRAQITGSALQNGLIREHHGTTELNVDSDKFADFEKTTNAVITARQQAIATGAYSGSSGGGGISFNYPSVKTQPYVPSPPDVSTGVDSTLMGMASNIRNQSNGSGNLFLDLANKFASNGSQK